MDDDNDETIEHMNVVTFMFMVSSRLPKAEVMHVLNRSNSDDELNGIFKRMNEAYMKSKGIADRVKEFSNVIDICDNRRRIMDVPQKLDECDGTNVDFETIIWACEILNAKGNKERITWTDDSLSVVFIHGLYHKDRKGVAKLGEMAKEINDTIRRFEFVKKYMSNFMDACTSQLSASRTDCALMSLCIVYIVSNEMVECAKAIEAMCVDYLPVHFHAMVNDVNAMFGKVAKSTQKFTDSQTRVLRAIIRECRREAFVSNNGQMCCMPIDIHGVNRYDGATMIFTKKIVVSDMALCDFYIDDKSSRWTLKIDNVDAHFHEDCKYACRLFIEDALLTMFVNIN